MQIAMIRHHVLQLHLNLNPYRCRYCGMSNAEKRIVKRHLTEIHPGMPPIVVTDPSQVRRVVTFVFCRDQPAVHLPSFSDFSAHFSGVCKSVPNPRATKLNASCNSMCLQANIFEQTLSFSYRAFNTLVFKNEVTEDGELKGKNPFLHISYTGNHKCLNSKIQRHFRFCQELSCFFLLCVRVTSVPFRSFSGEETNDEETDDEVFETFFSTKNIFWGLFLLPSSVIPH